MDWVMVLVKLLDPIAWGLALIGVFMIRRWWQGLVWVVLIAVVQETLLTQTQVDRVWGQGVWAGLVAGLILVYGAYGLKRLVRRV